MDFSKPIYGEIEGDIDAKTAKKYFKKHGIEYTEKIEDGYYVGSFHVFTFPRMTREELEAAKENTQLSFYQYVKVC